KRATSSANSWAESSVSSHSLRRALCPSRGSDASAWAPPSATMCRLAIRWLAKSPPTSASMAGSYDHLRYQRSAPLKRADAPHSPRVVAPPAAPRRTANFGLRVGASVQDLVPVTVAIVVVIARGGDRDHRAGGLVEDHPARLIVVAVEVEHVVERAGDGVERAARLNAL